MIKKTTKNVIEMAIKMAITFNFIIVLLNFRFVHPGASYCWV